MNKYFDQPIVILGGFLIDGSAYKEMTAYCLINCPLKKEIACG